MKIPICTLILFTIFLTIFSACDYFQHAKGYVFDAESKNPIDSVYIHAVDNPRGIYSDHTGKFSLLGKSVSPFSGPPIVMEFKKAGYDSMEVKGDGTDTQKVYLKKSKLQATH